MLILRFFSELLPSLLVGYLLGRFRTGFFSLIIPPLIDFGVPISLICLLLKNGLDWLLFQALVMSFLVVGLIMALIRIFPKLRRNIGCRSLLLGSVFGNSGYFGIPLALALLPTQSLSFSIGYDIGSTFLIWSLGPILLANPQFESHGGFSWKNLFSALASSPASKGLVGTVLICLTPWSDQIASALWIPSRIVIVLALMIVGMRLGSLCLEQNPVNRNFRLLIQPSLFIKLIILPATMLILSNAFGLSILMRNALVMQAATPTAISVLLLAEASGQEQQVASRLVSWSTLIAFITVPIWFLVIKHLLIA